MNHPFTQSFNALLVHNMLVWNADLQFWFGMNFNMLIELLSTTVYKCSIFRMFALYWSSIANTVFLSFSYCYTHSSDAKNLGFVVSGSYIFPSNFKKSLTVFSIVIKSCYGVNWSARLSRFGIGHTDMQGIDLYTV